MNYEDYASIAVVEILPESQIAISAISVTQSEVSLSGGWTFDLTNRIDIENVLTNKIIIDLSHSSDIAVLMPSSAARISTFKDFLLSAKEEAENALNTKSFN